jgi:hypothetical protein
MSECEETRNRKRNDAGSRSEEENSAAPKPATTVTVQQPLPIRRVHFA